MAQEHFAVIAIEAPPATVWALMADVERWPEWTASTSRVELLDPAPLAVGTRARIKQPRMPAMTWTVTALEPGARFAWETRSPGAHTVATHEVTPNEGGGSTVTLAVRQYGPLMRLLAPFMNGTTRRYIRMEAEGLKRRAEAAAGAPAAPQPARSTR